VPTGPLSRALRAPERLDLVERDEGELLLSTQAERLSLSLFQGQAEAIAASISAKITLTPALATDELFPKLTYFRNNHKRMHDMEFREDGFPLGSGMVESAAKQFKARFTGPGMRCSRDGLQRLLPIRPASLSKAFDDLWHSVFHSPPTGNAPFGLDDLSTFLDHLHRGGTVAHWWHDKGKELRWFNVNKRPTWPKTWDGNIYFSVHPCASIPDDGDKRYVRSRTALINAVNCFFAEYDAKDFGSKEDIKDHLWTLPIYPSVIIDSGGGYHCYFCLADTIVVDDDNRDHIKALQYAWVDFVGGDQASKDLARVLRPVGTVNRKQKYAPDYPTVDFVECDMSRLYTLEDIERLVTIEDKPKAPVYLGAISFNGERPVRLPPMRK